MEGKKYIQQLKLKWIAISIVQCVLMAIGFTLIAGSLLQYFFQPGIWVYAVILTLSACCILIYQPIWKINDISVARYLDTHFADLEDSTSLLLKPKDTLSTLERLQLSKIVMHLPGGAVLKNAIRKTFIALLFMLVALAGFTQLIKLPLRNDNTEATKTEKHKRANQREEQVLPQVAAYNVNISPPSYTGLPSRNQQQFYLKAELGATATWNLKTNISVKDFTIIFNDKEKIKLKPQNDNVNTWSFSRKIEKQGFYQLALDGVKSDLYQIEVIPDLPVTIKITNPKPQTTIDIGSPKTIDLNATLTDDYGITESYISATMASGKGESVSFTEKKLAFDSPVNGQRNLKLNKHIDLKSLGMKPGDELYFFIHATDNKGQQSRSDVYTVSIVDTAELMSMSGMSSGVNLVPEYFRSERQIILDTEKLLAEQKTITIADFNKRSNELGIDQKLLRLRYGQFLGEENETEIGGGDHDGHDHDAHEEHGESEEKFGDVQAIMDKYAHKHDIAEDASFFEPEIKAQLKAVLSEMWSAELKLRTYKPQEALPYAYKALRLLKDLQQKSRAYVAKTTIKTAALKPEKRLSGELDKIVEARQNLKIEVKNATQQSLKILLALLDLHQNGKTFDLNEKALLQASEKQLIEAAASHPGSFLPALKSLRRLSEKKIPDPQDIRTVSAAIYHIIGPVIRQPQSIPGGLTKKLSDAYFNNLNKY